MPAISASGLSAILVMVIGGGSVWAESPCEIGLAASKAGDVVNAAVALERCLASDPADDVRVSAKKARRAALARLDSGRFAEVALAIEPADATISLDAIQVKLRGDETLYLPLGVHLLQIERAGFQPMTHELSLDARERVTVPATLVAVGQSTTSTRVGASDVTFETEPPPALPTSRKQEAEEFPSLIPKKMQGGERTGDAQRSPRWPWAIVGLGAAIGISGVVAHVSGRERLALGLYLGGAVAIGGGAVTLAMTRRKQTIPEDPELRLSVAFHRSF